MPTFPHTEVFLRFRAFVTALLYLGLLSSFVAAQSPTDYTFRKINGPGPMDETSVAGKAYADKVVLRGDTIVYALATATGYRNSGEFVIGDRYHSIYAAPFAGGASTYLAGIDTRVNPRQVIFNPISSPSGNPTVIGPWTIWGDKLIYFASVTGNPSTITTDWGLFEVPLKGGQPTRILGLGDPDTNGDPIVGFNTLIGSNSPAVVALNDFIMVDIGTSSAQQRVVIRKNIAGGYDKQFFPYRFPSDACFYATSATNGFASSSDGNIYGGTLFLTAGGPENPLRTILMLSSSPAFESCNDIAFDPNPASGPVPMLPGEPTQPLNYTIPPATLSNMITLKSGKLYFSGSQLLADGTSYSGIFAIDATTHIVTKVLSNRDTLPDFTDLTPVPCPGAPAVANYPNLSGPAFGGDEMVILSQQTYACTNSLSPARHAAIYAYNPITSRFRTILRPGAQDPGDPINGAKDRLGISQDAVSAAGLLYQFAVAVHYYGVAIPLAYDLYAVSLTHPATLTLSGPDTASYGERINLTARLGLSSNTSVNDASGTMHLYDGSTKIVDTAINADGTAAFSLPQLTLGTHSLTVTYDGDLNYQASTSSAQSISVSKASSSIGLRASSSILPVTTATTLTATVASTTSTPTGTVTFLNGTTTLGTATIASGIATLNYTPTAAGTFSITASYNGDTNFNASTSSVVSITVGVPDYTITAAPPSATIRAGETATFAFTVTPSFGFNQPISFACAGLPANARCTFSPTSVTPNGSAVTSTLTVQTNVTSAQFTSPGTSMTGIAVAGLIVLPLLGFAKKNRKRLGMLSAALTFSALAALSGCSSGGSTTTTPSTPVTPVGSSTVAISAGVTGGGSHSVNVSLTIQ